MRNLQIVELHHRPESFPKDWESWLGINKCPICGLEYKLKDYNGTRKDAEAYNLQCSKCWEKENGLTSRNGKIEQIDANGKIIQV